MRRILPVVMVLAGCQMGTPMGGDPEAEALLRSEIVLTEPEAFDELCWAEDVIPAVMGKGEGEVLVAPEEIGPDGTVVQPAIYRTEETEIVVAPEKPFWFRTPCPDALEPQFISSVQRALEARGFYSGAITGVLDGATKEAIRLYQAPQGLDSAELSLKAAQQLGLANYDLEAPDG